MSKGESSTWKNLPVAYDIIHVRFLLNAGRLVWWPATVASIQKLKSTSEAIATASLVYDAKHGYGKERSVVEFLDNNQLVVVEDGRSGTTTWKYPDTMDVNDTSDIEGERTAKRIKLLLKTTANESTRRPSTRNAAGPSGQHSAAQKTTSSAYPTGHDGRQMFHSSIEDTTIRRLDALEHQMSSMSVCKHRPLIEERVDAVLLQLKFSLIKVLQRPLRFGKSSGRHHFEELIQRSSVTVILPVDLKLFQYLASHISALFPDHGNTDIVYSPSRKDVDDPPRTVEQLHIKFRLAAALFDVLGITNCRDVYNMVCREQWWKSGRIVRLLGGMQCKDASDPLHIFVGASCSTMPAGDVSTSEHLLKETITFPTGEWDRENGTMKTAPGWKKAAQGDLQGDSLDDSCFMLTWTWEKDPQPGSFTSHATRNGVVQLGTLTLVLPSVLFNGAMICTDISHLLSASLRRGSFH